MKKHENLWKLILSPIDEDKRIAYQFIKDMKEFRKDLLYIRLYIGGRGQLTYEYYEKFLDHYKVKGNSYTLYNNLYELFKEEEENFRWGPPHYEKSLKLRESQFEKVITKYL